MYPSGNQGHREVVLRSIDTSGKFKPWVFNSGWAWPVIIKVICRYFQPEIIMTEM